MINTDHASPITHTVLSVPLGVRRVSYIRERFLSQIVFRFAPLAGRQNFQRARTMRRNAGGTERNRVRQLSEELKQLSDDLLAYFDMHVITGDPVILPPSQLDSDNVLIHVCLSVC